jgi:hypothetical protein
MSGISESGSAAVALMDSSGKKRIAIEVASDGTPSISFLDANGRVINQITPPKLN